jgi:hypothetical protein
MAAFNGTNAPTMYLYFYNGSTFVQVATTDIREVTSHRGRVRNDQEFDTGLFTIVLDNRTGIYDPDYTGSTPMVVSGVSIIQRSLAMYFGMTWVGTMYNQFYGYLENVEVNEGFDATVTLTFTDGTDLLATSFADGSYAIRNAETTKDRVSYVKTLCVNGVFDLETNLRSTITNAYGTGSAVTYTGDKVYLVGETVSITGVTPTAYNLSNQIITSVSGTSFTVANVATGGYVSGGTAFLTHVKMQATLGNDSPLSMMQEAARCEGNDFYITNVNIDAATPRYISTIIFHPMAQKFNRITRLAFSDSQAAGTIEYDSIQTSVGTLQKVNRAVIQYPDFNSTGSGQVSAIYGSGDIAGQPIQAPVFNPWAAINLAVYNARKMATPISMVKQIDFQAFALDTLYPDLLLLDLGDQVTVTRTTVDGRTKNYNLVVEGIDHSITPNDWRTTLYTSAMNPYYTVIDKNGG